jgi:rubrerythrin
LLFCNLFLFAEKIDCEKITSFLNQKEKQIEHLNLTDPDYIPLHYLLAQDIINELNQFKIDVIPFYTECSTISFSELINKYDELKNSIQPKFDSLAWLSKDVYLIFYQKSLLEYQLNNVEDAKYYLDRCLQYNDTFPDAILLKLNKLLDVNAFDACLSLLNLLYYETQLNREQEKQAIVFTDNFYDKLYRTADSLVKMEHSAEALVLFEILEIFCLNLPTAYCNDDYYHGVLRSKSGIYESYIAIARVAEKRGNKDIATHFYEYAQDYLENNPYLNTEVEIGSKNLDIEKDTKKMNISNDNMDRTKNISKQEIIENTLSPKEIKEQYDKMVLQALALCIKDNFSESYQLFKEAKKLEDCRCFEKDFRVELMLRELSRIMSDE